MRYFTHKRPNTIKKRVWSLTLPLIMDLSVGLSVPIVDFIFLSKLSPLTAVAVGAVAPVLIFCDVVCAGICTAIRSLASQALGRADAPLAREVINAGLVLTVWVGLFYLLVFYFFSANITSYLGLTGEAVTIATQYLSVVGGAFGLCGVRFLLHNVNTVYEQVRFNIYSALIVLTFNTIGNAAVAYNLWGLGRWGGLGIALTSVLSVSVSVIVCLFLQKRTLSFIPSLRVARDTLASIYKLIARVAVPASIDPLSIQVFIIFGNILIASIGEAELSLRILAVYLYLPCLFPAIAFSISSQILFSEYVGRRKYWAAKQVVGYTLLYSMAISGSLTVFMLLMSALVAGFFVEDTPLLTAVYWVFIPLAIIEFMKSIHLVVGMNLKASGDGAWSTKCSLFFTWCITAPTAVLVVKEYGFISLLWVFVVEEVLKVLYNLFRWGQGKWKTNLIAAIS